MKFKIFCSISLILLLSETKVVLAHPIDLFNTESQKVKLPLPDTGPGICKENLNNDNITNIKWYRYHNATHKCWHIDQRGPCGKLMLFYGIGDTEYGDCDCNLYYRCARPIIYWPSAKRCFYTNDKGPCGDYEWLVLNETQQPTCELNPCRHNQTADPSTQDRYWFEQDGHCYKTLTQGYCKNPQEILYPKWDEYKPSCNIGRICNSRNVRSSANHCVPGQRTDMKGGCRPPIRVTHYFPAVFFGK